MGFQPAGGLESIESVKELFLSPFFSGDELDVVEEKDINPAKGLTEGLHLLSTDAIDELVDELLGCHVRDLATRVRFNHAVADRVQEMGLAEPGAAIDIERVVGFARPICNRLSGGRRKLVGGTLDKTLENEARDEGVTGKRGS